MFKPFRNSMLDFIYCCDKDLWNCSLRIFSNHMLLIDYTVHYKHTSTVFFIETDEAMMKIYHKWCSICCTVVRMLLRRVSFLFGKFSATQNIYSPFVYDMDRTCNTCQPYQITDTVETGDHHIFTSAMAKAQGL